MVFAAWQTWLRRLDVFQLRRRKQGLCSVASGRGLVTTLGGRTTLTLVPLAVLAMDSAT